MKVRKNFRLDTEYDEITEEELGGSVQIVDGENEKIFIRITGEITYSTYEEVSSAIVNIVASKNTSDIVIFIDSSGGMAEPTIYMANLFKAMSNKIITVAFNECCSAACMLFALGEERYMLTGTYYLLHQVKSSLDTYGIGMQTDKIRALADSVDKIQDKYKKVVFESTNFEKEEFDAIFKKEEDTILNDEQVLNYGIATKIFTKFEELDI